MINLLPDHVKEDMYYGRKNRQILNWIITALFGVVILVIIAAVGRLTIQTARNQALVQKQNMEEQLKVADFESVNEEYSSYVNGLSNVKKLYSQQILYTRLIRKLGTLLPAGARLTNISISDKDRAIGLNFDNDADGLGPVIQLNLTDQGKQVASDATSIFRDNLKMPIVGTPNIDSASRKISFNLAGDEQTTKDMLKSSGDFAFAVVKNDAIDYLLEYDILSSREQGATDAATNQLLISANASLPQIRSYTVNSKNKYVDFVVRADTEQNVEQLADKLRNTKNSLFIETYVFEDASYRTKSRCVDTLSKAETCNPELETCQPTSKRGCQFIIRSYYDELFSEATVTKTSEEQKKNCMSIGTTCTLSISASYTQLFSKVDVNRVSSCIVDPTNGTSTCPVEMRAEFSEAAKFYLINTGATK